MNTIIFSRQYISARWLAAVTIVSMLLSAFPASFFVAEAATTITSVSNLTVDRDTPYSSGDLDISGHGSLELALNYDAEALDRDDKFRFGWRDTDGEHVIDTVNGKNEGSAGDESDNDIFPIVPGTGITMIDLFAEVEANSDGEKDYAVMITLSLTGGPVVQSVVEDKKTDLCHWNGQTFELLNVSVNSVGNAHGAQGVNDGDIIPVLENYGGQNLDVLYGDMTGAEVLANDCVVEDPQPVVQDNTCLVPNTQGEATLTVGISNEKTLQNIFNDTGFSGVDVEEDQLANTAWNFENAATDVVTIKVTVLGSYAGNKQAFGYYEAGDESSFTPLFKLAGHSAAVPVLAIGDSMSFELPNNAADSLGFGLDTVGNPSNLWLSEPQLNPNDDDNLAVYNPDENTYLLAFEDRPESFPSDNDYNDLVVKVEVVSCDIYGCMDEEADNYNENATVPGDVQCEYPPVEECVNLLTNGSFEDDVVTNATLWQKFGTVSGWLIEKVADNAATTLELHRDWSSNEAADGAQYAELDGDHSTKVTQSVTTIPGAVYELSWAFAPRHDIAAEQNQLAVMVEGLLVASEGPATAAAGLTPADWARGSYSFSAADAATDITFADAGPSNSYGTFLDDAQLCLVREPEPVATINASKIVCTDEADLPNWGAGGPNITPNTAAAWVYDHESCDLVEDWQFQWAPQGAADPGDLVIGELGTPWTTFTGSVEIPESAIEGDSYVWVREVMQEDYLPFTHETEGNKNTDNVTAEMYCHVDVLNYDNFDRVDVIKAGSEYSCVAWNVPVIDEPEVCTLKLTSDDVNNIVVEKGGALAVETFVHDAWTESLVDADWIWGDEYVVDPTIDETQTFINQFGWGGLSVTHATLTIAADNSFSAELNDALAGQDLGEFNYSSLKTYDVTSLVQFGNNDFEVVVKNFGLAKSVPTSNPAGLYYELTITGEGENCDIPYVPEPEEPEYGTYCGDDVVNQEWEQCDGTEGCTDYCTNQCSDLQLVKITLDEEAPESESFDGNLYLGSSDNMIPNGTWFNFAELGDDTAQSIALATEGLAIERTGAALRLAVDGDNARDHLDHTVGTIETKGIILGAVNRTLIPGWYLENEEMYADDFTKTGDDTGAALHFRTGPGHDLVSMVVSDGVPFDCSNDDGDDDNGDDEDPTDEDVTRSSGGGGSTKPRCELLTLTDGMLEWKTKNGKDLLITASGVEIFTTDDEVDAGNLYVGSRGAEYLLTVNRFNKSDTCTVSSFGAGGDFPLVGQVLGEQTSVVPFGGAAAGAGGTSPVELPRIQTISAILLREVARVAKNG
ncbi:MAG: DUF4114 domain-containing protein [Candidatus Pacebacteria bacterium]|nr:DUF4114 domain-containing protein [Candidatus Paceibacterota bacterium]